MYALGAGLSESQVTEVAYLLACALSDGTHEDVLADVLERQLNVSSSQAEALHDLVLKGRLSGFPQASTSCAELPDCVV